MAPFAQRITVSFEHLLRAFSEKKTVLTGNPARASIRRGSIESARQRFGLDPALPTVCIGGGTGNG